jgi:hypothetical protein
MSVVHNFNSSACRDRTATLLEPANKALPEQTPIDLIYSILISAIRLR